METSDKYSRWPRCDYPKIEMWKEMINVEEEGMKRRLIAKWRTSLASSHSIQFFILSHNSILLWFIIFNIFSQAHKTFNFFYNTLFAFIYPSGNSLSLGEMDGRVRTWVSKSPHRHVLHCHGKWCIANQSETCPKTSQAKQSLNCQ